jgi:hypothetical protein
MNNAEKKFNALFDPKCIAFIGRKIFEPLTPDGCCSDLQAYCNF